MFNKIKKFFSERTVCRCTFHYLGSRVFYATKNCSPENGSCELVKVGWLFYKKIKRSVGGIYIESLKRKDAIENENGDW